jgi:diguanylate cyclase (GGDEF)-like protein
MTSRMRLLGFLLASPAAAAGALWLGRTWPGLDPSSARLVALLPPVLAVAGVALGVWFRRDRPAFLHLVLVSTYGLPLLYRPGAGAAGVLLDGLGLAVALNLLVFALLPNRVPWSVAALPRLLLVAGQSVLLTLAVAAPQAPLGRLVLQAPAYAGTALGLGTLVMFGLAAATVAVTLSLRREPLHAGILVACAGTGWALHTGGQAGAVVAGWALAHLGLLLAQLQEAYRLAFIDGLTGLPGRRALEERMAALSGEYAVSMVDVDRFKRFNDRHGHEAGDHVLRLVARRLAGVGAGGSAFRYGGEEFAVVFPRRDKAQAVEAMEQVRRAVAATPFRLRQGPREPERRGRGGGKAVTVTISAGVADSRSGGDPPLKRADRALYRAKGQGRNRVCS